MKTKKNRYWLTALIAIVMTIIAASCEDEDKLNQHYTNSLNYYLKGVHQLRLQQTDFQIHY